VALSKPLVADSKAFADFVNEGIDLFNVVI
jgi:hypothetical protein